VNNTSEPTSHDLKALKDDARRLHGTIMMLDHFGMEGMANDLVNEFRQVWSSIRLIDPDAPETPYDSYFA
jgi:hypothetical protein